MIQAITVAPSAEGWTVKSDQNEMYFRSGASAEAAARSLAESIADAGKDAQIEIFLRDGALGGRYAYPRSRA